MTKKSTKNLTLNKTFKQRIPKREMHTRLNKNNKFYELIQKRENEDLKMPEVNYVYDILKRVKELVYIEMVFSSTSVLTQKHEILSKNSFVKISDDFYKNFKIDNDQKHKLDNIGIYDKDGKLKRNYHEIYNNYMLKSTDNSIYNNNTVLQTSKTCENSVFNHENDVEPRDPRWNLGDFIFSGLLIALIIGKVTWYRRRKIKKIDDIKKTNKNENLKLNSVDDSITHDFITIKTQLLLILIPSSIIILYNFGYYYRNKLYYMKKNQITKMPENTSKLNLNISKKKMNKKNAKIITKRTTLTPVRLTKSITYLTKPIYKSTKHFMHSETEYARRDLPVEIKANAFYLYGQGLEKEATEYIELKPYAYEAITYVARMVDQRESFSTIIMESEANLSYTIQKQSFVSIMESLKRLTGTDLTDAVIYDLDDLGIYDKQSNLMENWENIFDCTLNEIHKIQNITSKIIHESPQESSSSTTNSDTQSHHSFPVSSTTSSSRSSTPEGGYDFEFDGKLFNNGNNNTIILYTLAAFVVIQGLAWFFNDKKEHESCTEKTQEYATNNDSCLHSIYETSVQLSSIKHKMLLIIIPSCLLILYNFRYYYYYKLIIMYDKNRSSKKKKFRTIFMSANTFFLLQQKIEAGIALNEQEIEYITQVLAFVEEQLNNDISFSDLICKSAETFGERFSAQSFGLIIDELLCNDLITSTHIKNSDNLGLYDSDFELKENYKDIYDYFWVYYDSPDHSSDNEQSSKADSSSTRSSSRNSSHNENNDYTSNSSDNGQEDLLPGYGWGTYFTFGLFSLLIFGFFAWLKNKFSFREKEVSENNLKENIELNSVHDFYTDITFINKQLLMIFIPSFILILYHFRFYYYSRFNLLVKYVTSKLFYKKRVNGVKYESYLKKTRFKGIFGSSYNRSTTTLNKNTNITNISDHNKRSFHSISFSQTKLVSPTSITVIKRFTRGDKPPNFWGDLFRKCTGANCPPPHRGLPPARNNNNNTSPTNNNNNTPINNNNNTPINNNNNTPITNNNNTPQNPWTKFPSQSIKDKVVKPSNSNGNVFSNTSTENTRKSHNINDAINKPLKSPEDCVEKANDSSSTVEDAADVVVFPSVPVNVTSTQSQIPTPPPSPPTSSKDSGIGKASLNGLTFKEELQQATQDRENRSPEILAKLHALEQRKLLIYQNDEEKLTPEFQKLFMRDSLIKKEISLDWTQNITLEVGLLEVTNIENSILLDGRQKHVVVMSILQNDQRLVFGMLTSSRDGTIVLSETQPFSYENPNKQQRFATFSIPLLVENKEQFKYLDSCTLSDGSIINQQEVGDNYLNNDDVKAKLIKELTEKVIPQIQKNHGFVAVYNGTGITEDDINNVIQQHDLEQQNEAKNLFSEYKRRKNQQNQKALNSWLSGMEKTKDNKTMELLKQKINEHENKFK